MSREDFTFAENWSYITHGATLSRRTDCKSDRPARKLLEYPGALEMANSTAAAPAVLHAHAPTTDNAPPLSGAAQELESLRADNAALWARVDELEQQLTAQAKEAEQRWTERQAEYESLLEEKSEVIRSLHLKIAELREQLSAASRPPSAAVLDAKGAEELMQLKQELEDQRRQLEEDEQSMMAQLRQMELSLARDRAELARQRAELQRLHGDLKHEMETAARDSGLRERLSNLHRRSAGARPSSNQDTPPPGDLPSTPTKGGNSGIFRRLFGSSG
jgi:malate synthase